MSWFSRLWQRRTPVPCRPIPVFRPSLEALEDRHLPAAGIFHSLAHGPQFSPAQSIPTISSHAPLLPNLANTTPQSVTTVASNGDQNPYGVAFVPPGFAGSGLNPGDILVSDFNDSNAAGNVQGTGSSIVRITPSGQETTFFQGSGQLGLTTALGVLKSGFVIVGSAPNTNTSSVPNTNTGVLQGSLLFLNSQGTVVGSLSDNALLNGPWDLTINDQGNQAQVFVANVLSGTVTRIDLSIPKGGVPTVVSETQIASGYQFGLNGPALVVGPTGLAFDPRTDTLYVASTDDNAIFAIHNALHSQGGTGTGRLVVSDPTNLHGPLGLVLAPNGDLIVSNGDAVNVGGTPNELLEYKPNGKLVAQLQLDTGPAGAAFGIALSDTGGQLRFAAVDDNTNMVETWTFRVV